MREYAGISELGLRSRTEAPVAKAFVGSSPTPRTNIGGVSGQTSESNQNTKSKKALAPPILEVADRLYISQNRIRSNTILLIATPKILQKHKLPCFFGFSRGVFARFAWVYY